MQSNFVGVVIADLPGVPTPTTWGNLPLIAGAAVGGILVLMMLYVLLRKGKEKEDPEAPLRDELGALPAPPKGPRHYQLKVLNQPVRLRLVVIAPMGKRTLGKVDSALEQIFRGLGEVALDDKPRVRIWPPQLSASGFAPTFFRVTKRPDPEGKPSRWILLAGPARAGTMPVLLGLAVQADTPLQMGLMTMTETKWNEVLRVENA